ncbi:MAG: CRTAC1 family protein [Acidobacteriota bacterium]
MQAHSQAAWRPRHRPSFWLAVGWLLAAAALGEGPAPFTEIATESGLDFVHWNGMSGELYFAEAAGAGVGLLDCDGDGDLDVYLSQGAMLGRGKTFADAVFSPPEQALRVDQVPTDQLYRNELSVQADGRRELRFSDITAASGLRATGYGMGLATGDVDNDGAVDLFVTTFGRDQLWRGRGDCTFEDITESAGVGAGGAGKEWSVSASFADFDRDGWLDLYVGHYVDFDLETHKPCYTTSSARDYCGPRSYNPLPDRLYRNRGKGADGKVRFEDVSAVAGIALEFGGALGVIAADFNLDGWMDFYVANDQLANQLWINQKPGKDGLVRFANEAALAGVAVNVDGAAEASMGVDAADFDGDGDEDIFLTHLERQTNTIYVNEGDGWFSDETLITGLGAASLPFTSFGTAWIDYDNDSWVDLLIANGAVQVIAEQVAAKDPFPLRQPNQLFRSLGRDAKGGVRFTEVTGPAGGAFAISEVSRGAAFGDLDNDGDTDVVITNNSGPVRLLRNEVGSKVAWLGLRLLDPALQRDALGARVAVELPGRRTLWRRSRADGSFASANDPRVLVGLGAQPSQQVAEVRVVWPDGSIEVWRDLPTRRYTTLRKGAGETPSAEKPSAASASPATPKPEKGS